MSAISATRFGLSERINFVDADNGLPITEHKDKLECFRAYIRYLKSQNVAVLISDHHHDLSWKKFVALEPKDKFTLLTADTVNQYETLSSQAAKLAYALVNSAKDTTIRVFNSMSIVHKRFEKLT